MRGVPDGQHQKWTDANIEVALRELSAKFGYMPSVSEMRGVGRNDLICAVTKRGGILEWSRRLGLVRQGSDSDFGWDGEVAVCDLFRSRRMLAVRTKEKKAPFDLLVNGILRVDVKTANFTAYGACRGWFYRIGKMPQADLVVLYQHDTADFYGLPWFLCPTSNITISRTGGIYAAFLNNWPLIDRMARVRESERAEFSPMKLAG
jgi:hypothetical protein